MGLCVATATHFFILQKEGTQMKKTITLLLTLVLCLTLCACGSGEQDTKPQKPNSDNTSNDSTSNDNTNDSTSTDSTSQPEGESLIVQNPDNGKPMVNASRFNELLVKVEITTENWMDYIEVCSYTVKTVEKDVFGEIKSTETNTCYELGAKGNKYYYFYNFDIELKNKATGELMPNLSEVEGNVCLDEYECARIKGTLYLVDIPDEAIAVYPDIGVREFSVGFSDISYGPPCYCKLAGVDGRRIDDVPHHLLR
jgi:hypothetical protein